MPMNTTQLRKQIKNKKINVKNNNPTKRLNVKNNSEKKETK